MGSPVSRLESSARASLTLAPSSAQRPSALLPSTVTTLSNAQEQKSCCDSFVQFFKDIWTSLCAFWSWVVSCFKSEKHPLPEIPKSGWLARLNLAQDAECNAVTSLPQPPREIQKSAGALTHFFPFCAKDHASRSINDRGWGCAWRSIQICLSGIVGVARVPHLEELFARFGSREVLEGIYQNYCQASGLADCCPIRDHWMAPWEHASGWAEPFVGWALLTHLGFQADLDLLNDLPRRADGGKGCYSPADVFHQPPLSFAAFRQKLEAHFSQENAAPVIIDNGCYTITIIGIGFDEASGHTTLWLADPHVEVGVKPEGDLTTGLYTMRFDASGKPLGSSLSEEEGRKMSHRVDRGLDLRKGHMVLFPKAQGAITPLT
jgi:hypothetical protein